MGLLCIANCDAIPVISIPDHDTLSNFLKDHDYINNIILLDYINNMFPDWKLEFTTDDSSEEETSRTKKNRKRRAETESEYATGSYCPKDQLLLSKIRTFTTGGSVTTKR